MKTTLKKIITAITLTAIVLGFAGCSKGYSDKSSNFNIFPDPWSGTYMDEQRKTTMIMEWFGILYFLLNVRVIWKKH